MALSNLLSFHSQLQDLTASDVEPILQDFMVNTTIPLADMATVLETWLSLGPDRPIYRNIYGACKRTEQPWNPELVAYTQADIDALIHCTNFLLLPTWLNEKYLYPEILQRYLSHPEWTDWETWLSCDEHLAFENAVMPLFKDMKSRAPIGVLTATERENFYMGMEITIDTVYEHTHNLKHFHNVLAALMGLKDDQTGSPHGCLHLTIRGGHIPKADIGSGWDKQTLMIYACMSGSLMLVRYLESHLGIPVVNGTSTVLMTAVKSGNSDLVRYIAERTPVAKRLQQSNTLQSNMLLFECTPAIDAGRHDILDILFAAGIPSTAEVFTNTAAFGNNLATLEYIVSKGAPLTESVFRNAIRHRNLDMVKFAIRHKCPIHICFPYLCWELQATDILRLLMRETDMPALIQSSQPDWPAAVHEFIRNI